MSFLFIIQILYLLVPAAVANMAPVFAKKINFLNYSVDFGLKIGKNRLFGTNKTFRGFFFGVLGSIIFVLLQRILFNYRFFRNLSLVDYGEINLILFGFLIGFGVLFGDLIGSFIKRRLKVGPGKSLLVIDQINGGFGFALFIFIFYAFTEDLHLYFDIGSLLFLLSIVLIWGIGHLIIKYLGYLLGIDKKKI